MEIQRINYRGWPNCYRAANDEISLIVTADVGPRVIHLGFHDRPNLFAEIPETLGLTGGDTWRMYGGHRFWHAPEHSVRTYYPDNEPVNVQISGDTIHLVQPVEKTTGMQKEIEITLAADTNHVTMRHRLSNRGLWPVELAPWALSVMTTGGRAILPLPPRGSHQDKLLPVNALVMWAYNDMRDPRWTWGQKYIMLDQEPGNEVPQKLGTKTDDGWIAYVRDGDMFVKLFDVVSGATYPDMGCSVEMFTNAVMLELESLGPVVTLEPETTVEHVERWALFNNVPTPKTESDVEAHIMPRITAAQKI